jgi:TolB-like protein/DNA-binding winged helix-turn-helix (wHTH) protein/Tfp pilus assembly protein PilF
MNASAGIRDEKSLEQGFQLGELRIDPRAGEVSGPGGCEKLDPKVMDVLVMLAQHAGQVVLREDLLARIWPNAVVTDDALSRCLYELRRQLSQAGGDELYKAMLETVPKRGYRLNGNVSSLQPRPGTRPRSRAGKPMLVSALIAGVAAAVLLWFTVGRQVSEPAVGTPPPSANAGARSIAVLPFLDMSAGQDHGYLADGITEEILNRLAQAGNLRVIARTSSFAFRGKPADVREIAAKLGVSHVLEGSIRRSGDSIRITAQLIAASDNSHIWSETIDRKLGELFAIQDEIAASVATALQVTLRGGAPHGRMPASVEAYEQYLQGEFFYNRRAPGDIERSVKYYEQAVSTDPDYARAWAALSGAYSLLVWSGHPAAIALQTNQGEAAHKAVELDPRLAIAHIRLSRFYFETRDLKKAEEHLRTAVTLDPDDTLVLDHLSGEAFERGDVDKAVELLRRAVARDPLSIAQRGNLAVLLLAAGRLDEAMAEFLRVLEINPDAGLEFDLEIIRILVLQGRYDEARSAIARFPEGKFRDHGLALLYRAPDHRAQADAALERLAREPGDIMDSIRLAEVYAYRGMREEAFASLQRRKDELERNQDSGPPIFWHFQHEARVAPFLKPLHADPRWAALMADLD